MGIATVKDRTRGDGQSIPRRRHGEQFRFGTASRRVGRNIAAVNGVGAVSGLDKAELTDRRARFAGGVRCRRCSGERCSAYRDLGTRAGQSVLSPADLTEYKLSG